MGLTPNLDAMASRGTLFRSHIANQPLCAPSRANLLTGQYQNKNGVWRNGLGLAPDAVTLATALSQAGYTANYIGKWHLAQNPQEKGELAGAVAPEFRGGFLDFWEGANALEHTSHPYEGNIYDSDSKPIHFSGVYRVDFEPDRHGRGIQLQWPGDERGGPPQLVLAQYQRTQGGRGRSGEDGGKLAHRSARVVSRHGPDPLCGRAQAAGRCTVKREP